MSFLVDARSVTSGGGRTVFDALQASWISKPEVGWQLRRPGYLSHPSWPAKSRKAEYRSILALSETTVRRDDVPKIYICQSVKPWLPTQWDIPKDRIRRRVARLVASRAEVLVVPSQFLGDLVYRVAPKKKAVVVLPFGVEQVDWSRPTVPGSNQNSTRPFILVPSDGSSHKGHHELVLAIEQLAKFEFEVLFAGRFYSDAYERSLRLLISRGRVPERYRIIGALGRSDLGGLYRTCAAVVLPSKLESFGHPILEAAASGATVIARDLPPYRELVGSRPLYFKTRSDLESLIGELSQGLVTDWTGWQPPSWGGFAKRLESLLVGPG
jgi:glycosyltransferase involved in cell wall biosynthesis